MRHFLIESKLERNENENPVQTYLFINGGTLLFIDSRTLLLLNSGALVLLHGSALLLIHCVALLKIFRSILNSTKPDSHLFIHSIALLLVLSPASRRRSRSISRGC